MIPMTHTHETLDELYTLLRPGVKLSVTLNFGPNDEFSFTSSYIGHKESQFFVLDFPQKAAEALIMRKLTNTEVIVRGITASKLGHVVAFKSSVMCKLNQPCHMLCVREPSHFATKTIRDHERFSVHMPVEIRSNNVSYQATIVDVSVSGCAVFITGENELSTSSAIELHNDLSKTLPKPPKYSIVSINKEKSGHKLGIKFSPELELTEELKTLFLEQAHLHSKF